MASAFPNGTLFAIGTAYAATKAITAVTNANPGVATSTAHGYTDTDILLLSGFSGPLDQAVVRVSGSSTNTFNLEGYDTTSTSVYPTGFGVGNASKVTSFVSLSQVTDSQTSGGDQQFFQWQYLESNSQRQRPTVKSARSLTLTMDYDPSLAWHAALKAADLNGSVYVLRATTATGKVIYYSGYIGFDGEPSYNINQNQQVRMTFAYANPRSITY